MPECMEATKTRSAHEPEINLAAAAEGGETRANDAGQAAEFGGGDTGGGGGGGGEI